MEPKSIHTWLEPRHTDILAYQVDVCIVKFPITPDRSWLYFFSLQVNFTDDDEWGHGGLQWAGVSEFENSGNLGINWGGGSQSRGYGGLGQDNRPFEWECGKWYRYRVIRLDQNAEGLFRWGFSVLDLETEAEMQCDPIHTESEFISQAAVFTETGYGVRCETPAVVVHWREPCYRIPGGYGIPDRAVATYNGTCIDPHNTNQGLISLHPRVWFHASNSRRTVENYAPIWAQVE